MDAITSSHGVIGWLYGMSGKKGSEEGDLLAEW